MKWPEVINSVVKEESSTLCLASSSLKSVPPSVYEMKMTTSLVLDHNDIDEIQDELFQSLPLLQKLSLIGNELRKLPDNINVLSNLTELCVTENNLVFLPETLCQLTSLKSLKLVGNRLKRLPQQIHELTSLQELIVSENQLMELPENIGLLPNLEVVEANDNKLTKLSDTFGQLRKLRVLNVNTNELQELAESLAQLESIEELDVSNNRLIDFPTDLKGAHLLRKIYADANQICSIPDWFSLCVNLEELSIRDNMLHHNPFPPNFGDVCKKLRRFDLGGNFMSALCDSFGNLEALEYVHLGSVIDELERSNFQNGNWMMHLPNNFGLLLNLREAHLDENQLAQLPDNFGCLVNLEWLDLGQNQLTDLPESFGNLRALRYCQLSKNKLETLPSNFGELKGLQDLRLDNNKLTSLPDSFFNLSQLKILDLFNNNLVEVPAALVCFTNLTILDIDENDFGLPLMEIPQVAFAAHYAPRNPNMENNWRGRNRKNILEAELNKLESENQNDDPTEKATVTVLEEAIAQGSSLWQKHGESGKREKFVHQEKKEKLTEYGDNGDDEDERKEENWDDDLLNYNNSTSLTDDERASQAAADEDWEKELEEANACPYDEFRPVAQHPFVDPFNMHEHSRPDQFCPSDLHAPKVRKRRCRAEFEKGQFDDAD